ncbi:hypothetical protein KP509_03G097100 [Ceratopteris richardii]|uniref:Telomerase reverse transcriptase n=1 Tax=Ceratopteris richardii TaxID=49495 RepID=A0A8T2V9M3_CERRI|nr:hypothetical protein KP509_03G097100 [Ceratopteris richardii]
MGREGRRKRRKGRKKKTKKDIQSQREFVDGRILLSLYPSSRLHTLHDLLVFLLLPSIEDQHAATSKSAALLSNPKVVVPQTSMRMHKFLEGEQAASLSTQPASSLDNFHRIQPAFHAKLFPEASLTPVDQSRLRLRLLSDVQKKQSSSVSRNIEQCALLSEAAHSLLVHRDDPADYLSVIYQSYAVLHDTAPSLGSTVLEQRWSNQQVIERAIQILFKQGKNSANVLCFGFQQPRPNSFFGTGEAAPAGLACVSGNAAIRILKSEAWKMIHSRVAGTSVLFARQLNSRTQLGLSRDGFKEGQSNIRDQDRVESDADDNKEVESCIYHNDNCIMRSKKRNWHAAVASQKMDVSAIGQNVTSQKCRRPYSWQRRKMKRLLSGKTDQQSLCSVPRSSELDMSVDSNPFSTKVSIQNCRNFICASQGATSGIQDKSTKDMKVKTDKGDDSQQRNKNIFSVAHMPKSSSLNKAVNGALTLYESGLFPCGRTFPPFTTTMDEQPNGDIKGSEYRMLDFAFRSPHENPNIEKQQQKEIQQSKRKLDIEIYAEDEKLSSKRFHNSNEHGSSTFCGKKIISRSRMFYKEKYPRHPGLPKSHLLQRLKPTYKDAATLFQSVFRGESLCRCNRHISSLLKHLISNAKRCRYAQLLRRHCSPCATNIPSSQKEKSGTRKACYKTGFAEMEKVGTEKYYFLSQSQVVAFIWAVCRSIVPEQLLGSKKNWRVLRKNIFIFVSLRRHESFSLEQAMFKLKLSGYSWYQGQCHHDCCLQENLARFDGSSITKIRGKKPDSNNFCRTIYARKHEKGHLPKCQMLKRLLLGKWIYWLFCGLVIPLIQAHFYVTESESSKLNVLFYRKFVWAKVKSNAVKEMMNSNFKRLSMKSTFSILKHGLLGFSRGRLLPKRAGTRLIANLGSSSAFHSGYSFGKGVLHGNSTRIMESGNGINLQFKPINMVLRDTHHCLKYEQENHINDLGSSVFDYNDAYVKLLPYIIDHKRFSKANAPLYIVICDALKAFDSIRQEKLLEIIHEFVREEEYYVRRFGYASFRNASIKVYFERYATEELEYLTSLDGLRHAAAKQRNAVCVDQAYSVKLRRNQVLHFLKEHILRNIVKIGEHHYLQVVGIPQGSVLSSLLCSLYYGHFERSRLADTLQLNEKYNKHRKCRLSMDDSYNIPSHVLCKAHSRSFSVGNLTARLLHPSLVSNFGESQKSACSQSRLMKQSMLPLCISLKGNVHSADCEDAEPRNIMLRLIDDWLFISNSQHNALEFLRRMHKGFSEYNFVANRLKTAVSFDAKIGDAIINMNVYRTQDGACFIRWSGLLINCNTLEIQADYTRYCGVNLRSTLTVWRKTNPGIYLSVKICQFMRPKCHPIFYDGNINGPATAFLNAYQAFTLCAMKFHSYISSLPYQGKCNPKFGLKVILNCARYMHSLLVHRTCNISKRSEVKPLLLLHRKESRWLALRAFQTVLMRKQTRYKKLLRLIKTELSSRKYKGLGESQVMLSALDARRSSMFEEIIY